MSAVLRPLSQLLLRTSVSSTPKAIRSIPQSLGRKSSWCRRRHSATRRFSNTTKTTTFLFQEHSASGDGGDSAEELCLSDSCVQQLHKVTEEEPGLVLRVMVDGGGCSGFQYKIEFDTKINSDDKVFERGGVSVVVDELSLGLLGGCTVDYHTELIRSGFSITGNPHAQSNCSCGVSFAPK